MRVPLAWLRDYVAFDLDADAVAERFATLGFPVDAIERRTRLSGVLVGRLAKVEKHPDADRLQVCTVDVGAERTLTIATAATNVATGDVVPVATIGAELVGLTIAPRTMRGIASEGMLCSAAEVGLPGDWFEDGILRLESDVPIGTDFVALYGLNDDVLDVEITANRVDAMSVLGLARELAASLGVALREPATDVPAAATAPDPTPADVVTIASPDCRRVVAQRVSNVASRVAPFWMRSRLALAGQRPIDGIVDVSNFVMLECAQPLHFYDYAKLAGGALTVRDARDGETIRTLDGAERALDSRFLVLADEREPQCVAGLMGGASSEVTAQTRDVLIEAATFAGPRVRRMSVAFGLRTEASSRHEKGLPPALATFGAARAAHLLARAGATVHAPFVAGTTGDALAPIAVPIDRFRALLGIEITASEAAGALRALGFVVEHVDDAILAVPPGARGDVRIAEDVIEEVARIVGYDRIVAEMPAVFEHGISSDAYRNDVRVAHALAARGYRENVSLALQSGSVATRYARAGIAPGAVVEIANPLSEDQRYLRFSLLPGLLANAARYGAGGEMRSFELGHVFAARDAADANGRATDPTAQTVPGEPFAEVADAAWFASSPAVDEPHWRDSGFAAFKADALALVRALVGREAEVERATEPGLHPGKTAALLVDGARVATIGAVDPRLLAAFDLPGRAYAGSLHVADLPAYRAPRFRAPSRYPSVARDLALVVAPHVSARAIEDAVRAGAGDALASVDVFDEYRGPQVGPDKKSLAVRVVLQRDDATLTDADAEARVAAILASLRERCEAVIRS